MFHHPSIRKLLKLFLFFDFLFSMYRSIDHFNTFLGWHWRGAGWSPKDSEKKKMDIFPMVCRPMTNCWMAGPSLLFTGCHLRIHPRKIKLQTFGKIISDIHLVESYFFRNWPLFGKTSKNKIPIFHHMRKKRLLICNLVKFFPFLQSTFDPKTKMENSQCNSSQGWKPVGAFPGEIRTSSTFSHLENPPTSISTNMLPGLYYNSPTIEGLMNVGCLFCCLVIFDDTLRQTNSEFAPKM